MPKYEPDPSIERLVHEMNRLAEGGSAVDDDGLESRRFDLDGVPYRVVETQEGLAELLFEMARRRASDLILFPTRRSSDREGERTARTSRPPCPG